MNQPGWPGAAPGKEVKATCLEWTGEGQTFPDKTLPSSPSHPRTPQGSVRGKDPPGGGCTHRPGGRGGAGWEAEPGAEEATSALRPLSLASGAGKARQMPDCLLVVEKLVTKATTAAAPGPDSQALTWARVEATVLRPELADPLETYPGSEAPWTALRGVRGQVSPCDAYLPHCETEGSVWGRSLSLQEHGGPRAAPSVMAHTFLCSVWGQSHGVGSLQHVPSAAPGAPASLGIADTVLWGRPGCWTPRVPCQGAGQGPGEEEGRLGASLGLQSAVPCAPTHAPGPRLPLPQRGSTQASPRGLLLPCCTTPHPSGPWCPGLWRPSSPSAETPGHQAIL